jgi:dolichol-phosphate mannosyltransferase
MLTIVLPAYNEAAGLGDLLERIGQAVGSAGPFQILVVDDGSTDGTSAIAQRAACSLPVRVLSHPVNRGYGCALQTGLTEAVRSGGTIVTLDADESHDPGLIVQMLEQIDAGCDVVIASRFRAGGAEIGVPWYRRLLSHSVSRICRSMFPLGRVKDFTSGFRAYRSSLLERMIIAGGPGGLIQSCDFAAGLELLLRAGSLGALVVEIPLVLRYDRKRSASKLRLRRDLPPYIGVLSRQWLMAHPIKRPDARGAAGVTDRRPASDHPAIR